MGAMNELSIDIAEVCYPNEDGKQYQMLYALRRGAGPWELAEHTPKAIREYFEEHHVWPPLDIEQACEMVKKFAQPDPVCVCGKTTEGTCPRCGQTPLRNPAYDGPDGIFTDYSGPDNPNKEIP